MTQGADKVDTLRGEIQLLPKLAMQCCLDPLTGIDVPPGNGDDTGGKTASS